MIGSRNMGCCMKSAISATAAPQLTVAAQKLMMNRVTVLKPRISLTTSSVVMAGYMSSYRSVICTATISIPAAAMRKASVARPGNGWKSCQSFAQKLGRCGKDWVVARRIGFAATGAARALY